MKPVIGISVDVVSDPHPRSGGKKLQLNWNYADAIAEAGGIPMLIPPQADAEAVSQMIDGLMIPGGNDIDARHFGQENHPASELISEDRFESERRLYEAADPDLPIFGICYGCQFINVAHGGSMIQHLPDVLGHDHNAGGTLQEYKLDPNSKVAAAVGAPVMEGQSWHHQAVGEAGAGIKIVARDPDGMIEALEAEDRPWVVGVQWHPERTLGDDKSAELFKAFVAAAAKYRAKKGRS